MLMYKLRENYWILKGRKNIKEVIKTCIICKRFNAKPISVSELLPQDRVRDAAVFEIIGLDLAGPLILENGEKNWILIFTCAAHRAIHLELLTSVLTEFLARFKEIYNASEGSHLCINIDPKLSRAQLAAISSMQPCSSVSNGGAGLEPRAEASGHQQAETSLMQPCSSDPDGEAGVEPRFGLAIHKNDHQARRRFVEWAENEIAVVPYFHKRILFSDEAHFWLNSYVNKQNCRIWSEVNPQVYVETPLHPEKLTVWCALWADGIIGPYFFKNDESHNVTVNGDRYRSMITNFFIPELNNHDVQELWFQQDGATCHTARATID
ncbi:putative DD41D transposase [Trichonephila clavipes]|nr:putative DD41D transposase [Trichonephila clavipes]